MEPLGHLLAMAAELALKAFLANRGVDDRLLSSKKIGHDLGGCLRLAINHGLEVSEPEARAILAMRDAHLSHFNRYGPKVVRGEMQLGLYLLAKDELVLPCIASLIDRISGDPKTLRKLWQHPSDLDWPDTLPLLTIVDARKLSELEADRQRERDRAAEINNSFKEGGNRR